MTEQADQAEQASEGAAEQAESESTETSPASAAASTAQERLAKAYAIEAGMLASRDDEDEEPDEAEVTKPDVQAPKKEPTEGAPPSTIAELKAIAEKRGAERKAREAEQAKASELDELRAQVKALSERPASEARAAGIDPAALKSDPIGTLQAAGLNTREILQAMTQGVLNPGVPQLEQRLTPKLSELEQRLAAIEEAKQQAPIQAAEQSREAAKSKFAELTGPSGRWQALARLPEPARISWGWELATEAYNAGQQLTDEQIADLMENELSGNGSQSAAATAVESSAARSGDEGGRRNGRPRSITNDLAAPTARRKPVTEAERLALAKHLFATGE